jgi:hypothetical protein
LTTLEGKKLLAAEPAAGEASSETTEAQPNG